MGARMGLPVVHLDVLSWSPGWVQIERAAFDRLLAAALRKKRWIIDGNFGRTMEWRISRADTVVFLDLPRMVCIWRVLWRVVKGYGRSRPDMGPGCPERLDWEFLKFVWNYPERNRPKTLEKIAKAAKEKQVFHLKSRAEVARFVAGL
jgi:adenylate kinase family enzyme